MSDKSLFEGFDEELDFPGEEVKEVNVKEVLDKVGENPEVVLTEEEKDALIDDNSEVEDTEEKEEDNDNEEEKTEEDALADMFEEQAKNSKGTKKGGKKSTASATTTTTTPAAPPKPKDLTGYKVVVYGDELFTVDDAATTEEDIRKTLEETYQYIEFSKNKTVIHVNEENKVITPHVKFQNKG